MKNPHFHSCWLIMLVIVAGCGRSQTAGDGSAPEFSSLPISRDSAPGVVVAAFLDALRNGDKAVAEQLLTPTAREQTAAYNLPVQAPGSPDSTYAIGEIRPIQGGILVASRWTDRSPSGESIHYDIDWVLREEAAGWRVVGLSTTFTNDGEPVSINFEDVEDMLRKWDEADAELARQQDEAAAIQARQGPARTRR